MDAAQIFGIVLAVLLFTFIFFVALKSRQAEKASTGVTTPDPAEGPDTDAAGEERGKTRRKKA